MTTADINTNAPTPATTPAHRLWLLAKYYASRVRKQAVVYACASFVFAILLSLNISTRANEGLFLVVFTAMPYMFAFSPIILAKGGDTRPIERMIPASPAQKFFVQAAYIFIGVPLLVYTLPMVALIVRATLIHIPADGLIRIIYDRLTPDSPQFYFNIADNLATTSLAFYVVTRARSSRMLCAIIAVAGYQVACGIIGAIFGAYWAFQKGFNDAMAGRDPNMPKVTDFVNVLSEMQLLIYIVGVISAILTIIFLFLAYRQISRKQL